jgi:hypothetical protein
MAATYCPALPWLSRKFSPDLLKAAILYQPGLSPHPLVIHCGVQLLIVVTPMQYSDDLRIMAHGSATKRPNTLRTMNLMYDLGDVEKTKT